MSRRCVPVIFAVAAGIAVFHWFAAEAFPQDDAKKEAVQASELVRFAREGSAPLKELEQRIEKLVKSSSDQRLAALWKEYRAKRAVLKVEAEKIAVSPNIAQLTDRQKKKLAELSLHIEAVNKVFFEGLLRHIWLSAEKK